MRDELLVPDPADGDEAATEAGLRPRRLAEFVGQAELKEHLTIILEAARRRNQPSDHLLFAGPPGLGKPVAVDTLVLMGGGHRRPIGEIEPGDEVITHSGVPRAVTAVYDQGELSCLRISTENGRQVVTAPDHPFLTPSGWTKAADLVVGSALTNVACPRIATPALRVPAEQFRLAGYVVGRWLGGVDERTGRGHVAGGDSDTVADDWFTPHGPAGHDLQHGRVPEFVFAAPSERVAQFLAAAFARDGSRRGGVIEARGGDRALLDDLQHLLLRVGIRSLIERAAGPDRSSWRLTVADQDALVRSADAIPPPTLLRDTIATIDDAGLVACRCITVADEETYTVADLVCHNTTLAGIVAAELDVALHVTSGPALERAGDLAAILSQLGEGDVLFIDEIHRLSRAVEEVMYPAMEDFQLDIVLGKGPAARSIRLDVPPFTLVGATTRTGLITGPLRDRFGLVARLDYYAASDLESIVARAAEILEVPLADGGATEIARRSRGTPRIANRLLRRVRDFADVRGDGTVDEQAAKAGLEVFGVDERGLDKVDRSVLRAICERFGGGPVGLSTLAISVGEPTETVEDVYEPFLIREGLLMRTPRGRVALPAAWVHLGLVAPSPSERPPGLF